MPEESGVGQGDDAAFHRRAAMREWVLQASGKPCRMEDEVIMVSKPRPSRRLQQLSVRWLEGKPGARYAEGVKIAERQSGQMRKLVLLLCIAVGWSMALVRAYTVEPRAQAQSGWTSLSAPDNCVSEVITVNFDMPISASLFVGAKQGNGACNVYIYSYPRGNVSLAQALDVPMTGSYYWLDCSLSVVHPDSFIKGRRIEVRWTRAGTDSINYFHQTGDSYEYGHLKVGQTDHAGKDLCMRVYGVMDVVSDDRLGVNFNLFSINPDPGADALVKAVDSCGLRLMRSGFTNWKTYDLDTVGVVVKSGMYTDHGVKLLGILGYGLDAHTTKPSAWSRKPQDPTFYPPRNLFVGVNSSARNPWAEYVRDVMASLPDIEYWFVWNEANACSTYFGVPDTKWYKGSTPGPLGHSWIDTPRERCSLYVRMCRVAREVADDLGHGQKVVAGEVARLLDTYKPEGLTRGVDWLGDMLDLAENRYGGTEGCLDVVSVHPYQHVGDGATRVFSAEEFRVDLDAARAVMRQRGVPEVGLWVTEVGWNRYLWNSTSRTYELIPGASATRNADNLVQFFVSAVGSQSSPKGCYDCLFWWVMSDYRNDGTKHEGYGLCDSTLEQLLTPKAYALGHLTGKLNGMCLNGRVLLGDERDERVRLYEFEDPGADRRMWVCWRNGDARFKDGEPPPVDVSIPVRTDVVEWEYCAYGPDNPGYHETLAADGWFDVSLTTRPRFILEPVSAPIRRPDLVVDSIRVEPGQPKAGMPMFITAWVRNQGNGSVPPDVSAWVDFCWNDSLLKRLSTSWPDSVPEGGGELVFGIESVPSSMRGSGLLRVTANPAREFVELDHDNNSAFRVITVRGRSEQ